MKNECGVVEAYIEEAFDGRIVDALQTLVRLMRRENDQRYLACGAKRKPRAKRSAEAKR